MFDLYVNHLGDEILDGWEETGETMAVTGKNGQRENVPVLDVLCTRRSRDGVIAIAAVNKHPSECRVLNLAWEGGFSTREYRVLSIQGESTESYNDVDREQVKMEEGTWQSTAVPLSITLPAHSVQVIEIV